MLEFRQYQTDQLFSGRLKRFADEAVLGIRKSSPQNISGLSEPEIEQRQALTMSKALSHGFQSERDLRAFIRLSFAAGPCFDEFPVMDKWLSARDVAPFLRMENLLRHVAPSEWIDASVFDVIARYRTRPGEEPSVGISASSSSLTLERMSREQSARYAQLSSHPDVWRPARLAPPRSLEQVEQMIQRSAMDSPGTQYAILDGALKLIGAIRLRVYTQGIELSYWLGRAYWGRGLASSALAQMLGRLDARRPRVKLFARVHRENSVSARLLLRCGFALVPRPVEPGGLHVFMREPG